MEKKEINVKGWMPLVKTPSGSKLIAVLSDTSVDRDGEIISSKVLNSWAEENKVIPALSDHQNEMRSFVGGFKNLRTVSSGLNTALIGEPFFFSTPKAQEVQKQVEEALEQGLNPGISVGFIAREMSMEEREGKKYPAYTVAELVETTFVPVQSNRNASAGYAMAKKFNLFETENSTIIVENKTPTEDKKQYKEVAPMVDEVKEQTATEETPDVEEKKEVPVPEQKKFEKEFQTYKEQAEARIKALEEKLSKTIDVQKMPKSENLDVANDTQTKSEEITWAKVYSAAYGRK